MRHDHIYHTSTCGTTQWFNRQHYVCARKKSEWNQSFATIRCKILCAATRNQRDNTRLFLPITCKCVPFVQSSFEILFKVASVLWLSTCSEQKREKKLAHLCSPLMLMIKVFEKEKKTMAKTPNTCRQVHHCASIKLNKYKTFLQRNSMVCFARWPPNISFHLSLSEAKRNGEQSDWRQHSQDSSKGCFKNSNSEMVTVAFEVGNGFDQIATASHSPHWFIIHLYIYFIARTQQVDICSQWSECVSSVCLQKENCSIYTKEKQPSSIWIVLVKRYVQSISPRRHRRRWTMRGC